MHKELITLPTHLTSADVNNKYFTWLCNLVGTEYNNKSYEFLIQALHDKDFYWTVPNDDNRAFEGKELRCRFCFERNIFYDYDQFREAASMFELIIALGYRCESIMVDQNENIPMRDWFWRIVANVSLDRYTDYMFDDVDIDIILTTIINRTYHPSGRGGLFPLKKPERSIKKDQRKVELWYQMSSYLVENYYTEDMFL